MNTPLSDLKTKVEQAQVIMYQQLRLLEMTTATNQSLALINAFKAYEHAWSQYMLGAIVMIEEVASRKHENNKVS